MSKMSVFGGVLGLSLLAACVERPREELDRPAAAAHQLEPSPRDSLVGRLSLGETRAEEWDITPLDSAVVRLGTPEATERDFELLEAEALAGDYQQQRNLSYSLSTSGWWGYNPILGCAWRMVILMSGSPRVNETDVSNKSLYCDQRLDHNGRIAASAQAETLHRRIYRQD